MYRTSSFSEIPEVVKNLLIINVLLFLATISLESKGINLIEILGISHPQSNNFRPYQLITHMFMHGSFSHLFFNMFFTIFGVGEAALRAELSRNYSTKSYHENIFP